MPRRTHEPSREQAGHATHFERPSDARPAVGDRTAATPRAEQAEVIAMEDVDNAEAVAGRVAGVVDVVEELQVAAL